MLFKDNPTYENATQNIEIKLHKRWKVNLINLMIGPHVRLSKLMLIDCQVDNLEFWYVFENILDFVEKYSKLETMSS